MDAGMFVSVCFPLLLISAVSLLASAVFHAGFCKTVPLAVLSVIVILYPFYAADCLRVGRILLAALSGVLCVALSAGCFRVREWSQRLRKTVTSTPFLVYCALVLLLLLLSANKFVCLWDSLRLWGAYPKALWTYETRQLGTDAIIYPVMQSYPPGMPLLCYFLESFSGSFHEGSVYFTYGYFNVILILPIIEIITEKSERAADKGCLPFVKMLFFALAAAIVLPWLLYRNNGAYVTLYIDPPLGLLAGYYFTVCFSKGKTSVVSPLLSGICLVLLKDSGILFALAGAVGMVIGSGFGENKKKNLLQFAGISAAFLAVWYSWRCLLNVYSVSNHLSHEIALPGVSQIARFAAGVFKLDAVEMELVFARIGLSFPAVLLILFSFKLIPAYFGSGSFRKELAETVILLTTAIVFLAGYYFVFQTSISEENDYPSYSRYLGSIVLCVVYVIEYDAAVKHFAFIDRQKTWLRSALQKNGKRQRFAKAVKCFLLSFAVIISVGALLYIYRGKEDRNGIEFVRASELADTLVQTVGSGGDELTDVYLCLPGDFKCNERLHHRTYFELIDNQIRIKNFYLTTDITSKGKGYSSGKFIDKLIEDHCDYVMFSGISEDIYHEFNDILGDVSIGDRNIIYRVNTESRSIDRFYK